MGRSRREDVDLRAEALLELLPADGRPVPLSKLARPLGSSRATLKMLARRLERADLAVLGPRNLIKRAQLLVVVREQIPFTWGENQSGQLGDGTTTTRATPAALNLSSTVAVAMGHHHGLALRRDGALFAWGGNVSGALGDGTTQMRTSPFQLSGIDGVIAISCEWSNSYAVRNDGTLWAWGYGPNGALGTNWPNDSLVPIKVPGLSNMLAVAAGMHKCHALKSDGTVWGWGLNSGPQVVGGAVPAQKTPLQATGIADVVQIAAGHYHTIALKSDGTVWGWGYNLNGALGDGTNVDKWLPVKAVGLPAIVAVGASASTSYAIDANGSLWAFGFHGLGLIGWFSLTPVQVPGITDALAAGGGNASALVLKKDGTVWGWKSGLPPNAVPFQVAGLAGAVAVEAASSTNIVLVQARAALAPDPLDFGTRAIGSTTTLQATLTNTGSLPISVSSVYVAPNLQWSGEFTSGPGPTSLAAGGSAQIDVTFAPQAAADRKEALVVKTDQAGWPGVTLLGSGQ